MATIRRRPTATIEYSGQSELYRYRIEERVRLKMFDVQYIERQYIDNVPRGRPSLIWQHMQKQRCYTLEDAIAFVRKNLLGFEEELVEGDQSVFSAEPRMASYVARDDAVDALAYAIQSNKHFKETQVTTKLIETRTFICGNIASDVSDDQIFNIIKRTETEIAGLEAIKSRPKKLQAKIDSLKNQIEALVAHVDSR